MASGGIYQLNLLYCIDIDGKMRVWALDNEDHTLKKEVCFFSFIINQLNCVGIDIRDIAWDSESKRIAVCGDGRGR